MARSTVFRYKGKEADPRAVGAELNVRAIVSGRIVQRGDSFVLGLELVDTLDGAQLWSCYYNRPMAEIFSLQEQIASEIADKLRVRLSGAQRKRLTKRHTQNTEAYQVYLRGRYQWALRTAESLRRALEYFREALALDARYALAHVGIAETYLIMQYYNLLPPAEARAHCKAALARALEIDADIAEAHVSLGVIKGNNEYQWEQGEAEFLRAIELNPNYPTAYHWYGLLHLGPLGRFDEAYAMMRKALELDPLSPIVNTHYGMTLISGSSIACWRWTRITRRRGSIARRRYGACRSARKRLMRWNACARRRPTICARQVIWRSGPRWRAKATAPGRCSPSSRLPHEPAMWGLGGSRSATWASENGRRRCSIWTAPSSRAGTPRF